AVVSVSLVERDHRSGTGGQTTSTIFSGQRGQRVECLGHRVRHWGSTPSRSARGTPARSRSVLRSSAATSCGTAVSRLQRKIPIVRRPVWYRSVRRRIKHGAMDMADETVLDADRVREMISPTLVAGTAQEHHRHHDDLLLHIHHLHTPRCDLREPEVADGAAVTGAVESARARRQRAAESGEAVLVPRATGMAFHHLAVLGDDAVEIAVGDGDQVITAVAPVERHVTFVRRVGHEGFDVEYDASRLTGDTDI